MEEQDAPGWSSAEKFAAGFSAVVFALLLGNLSGERQRIESEWALWAFCVSLPLLLIWWLQFYLVDKREWRPRSHWASFVLVAGGYGSGFVGLVLTIGAVSESALIIFFVSLVIGLFLLIPIAPEEDAGSG